MVSDFSKILLFIKCIESIDNYDEKILECNFEKLMSKSDKTKSLLNSAKYLQNNNANQFE
jgi:hypothetical protein